MMSTRTKNFAQNEITALVRLVHKHRKAIECRGTDKVSNEKKDNAWRQIETEFNSKVQCREYRDMNILRTKFRNLKNCYKKRAAEQKMLGTCSTDGSPSQWSREQPIVEQLSALLPHSEMSNETVDKGEELEFVSVKVEPSEGENICDDTSQVVTEELDTPTLSRERSDPNELKSTENLQIRVASPGGTQLTSSWDNLASVKAEWVVLKAKREIEIMNAEHALRMRLMHLDEKKKEIELEVLKMQLKN